MFVRLLHLEGDPGALNQLTGFVATCVQPAVECLEGSMGLALWVDRDEGAALLGTVWATEAALGASEEAEEPLRRRAAELMGGRADVDRFEGALIDALRPVQAGNVMRLQRIRAASADIYDHVAWARNEVIPVLHRTPGYLAYFCGVNRGIGAAVVMATYHDRTDADIALMTTSTLREAAADRGVIVDERREFEVAIAGIRISLPPLPTQRSAVMDREDAVFWTPTGG